MTPHVDHPPGRSDALTSPSVMRRLVSRVVGVRAGVSDEMLRVLPVVAPAALGGAAAAAAAGWSFAASSPSGRTLLGVFALFAASAIAEAYPVPIEGVASGRTSLATVFIVATSVIYGWSAATVVAALAMVL